MDKENEERKKKIGENIGIMACRAQYGKPDEKVDGIYLSEDGNLYVSTEADDGITYHALPKEKSDGVKKMLLPVVEKAMREDKDGNKLLEKMSRFLKKKIEYVM